MLPVEFIVGGPPISQQTKNRQRLRQWKDEVRAAAAAALPKGFSPVNRAVLLKASFYFTGAPLDTDNMVKPIQDALEGLIYVNDRLVTDVHACKRSLDGSFRVRGMSPILAQGFISGRDFLHIVIEEAPDPEVMI